MINTTTPTDTNSPPIGKITRAERNAYLDVENDILVTQCLVDRYRASGPGGQKRNKTDSAVRLRHQPSGLLVIAEESRSQHENLARAIKRLRQAIALSVRVPPDVTGPREPSQPGEVATRERLRIGRRDGRYNTIVAEVLDVLVSEGVRVAPAADKLGISTASLVAFFERDVKLWGRVNELRRHAGLPVLRRKTN